MRNMLLLACLIAAFSLGQTPARAQTLRLTAHRGGVVDATRPENSRAAAEAAIARGYWMLEVDVRESKDGHLVMQHNPTFKQFYGVDRAVGDMTWSEIRQLRSKPGNAPPLEFQELAALCRNRVRLMIDTKEPSHPKAFYIQMEDALRKNGLLDSTYFIGTEEARAWFKGKARIFADRKELQAAMTKENAGKLYFLFEHGTDMDQDALRLAARAGVPAVISVNLFHYDGGDPMAGAKRDITRLLAVGATDFQIDSDYEVLFPPGTFRRP